MSADLFDDLHDVISDHFPDLLGGETDEAAVINTNLYALCEFIVGCGAEEATELSSDIPTLIFPAGDIAWTAGSIRIVGGPVRIEFASRVSPETEEKPKP